MLAFFSTTEHNMFDQIHATISSMITVSEAELHSFIQYCSVKNFKKQAILNKPGVVPDEIFFINKGLLRVLVMDHKGVEHTLHFAMENQFIADYSSFMRKEPSMNTLQAIEATEVVVIPRKAVEWGYENMKQGDRLGRYIAEYYFIYQDNRNRNQYVRTPKERYDSITDIFPNIHNRVPQHMIASYLGITPVHLSRLKKAALSR